MQWNIGRKQNFTILAKKKIMKIHSGNYKMQTHIVICKEKNTIYFRMCLFASCNNVILFYTRKKVHINMTVIHGIKHPGWDQSVKKYYHEILSIFKKNNDILYNDAWHSFTMVSKKEKRHLNNNIGSKTWRFRHRPILI